ncbi:MAG TPA: DUF58 domain-containing protein, partial [Pirellulales bacterium]
LVKVKNTGWLPIAWLLLEDSLPKDALVRRPPALKVDGKRIRLMQLKPGETAAYIYQLQLLGRGYHQIGPLVIETGDLFGLHRRWRAIADPVFILVYPKVIHIPGYDVASRRPIGEVRMAHRLFEDPTRISGVREYQPGDPLRQINWKATARTGVLHSKTYEPSSLVGATIVLEFHRDSYDPSNEPFRSELAATTAVSLANVVSLLGQQVGFVTNGRDAADRIRTEGPRMEFRTRTAAQTAVGMETKSDRLRPLVIETRRGPEQFSKILETVARVELTDGLTLPQLLAETAPRFSRHATVIVILPAVPPETAIALGYLRRQGFAVTAVLLMFSGADEYYKAAGALAAEHVEFRCIENEDALVDFCEQQLA